MIQQLTFTKFSHKVLLTAGLLAFWGLVLGVIFAPSASASITLNPSPGGREIPAARRTYLRDCDSGTRSPALTNWISNRTNYSEEETEVEFGEKTVNLTFHMAGAVCFQPSTTTRTRTHIRDTDPDMPNIQGLEGNTLTVDWTPGQNKPGTYRHDMKDFTYTKSDGFTVSGKYYITVYSKTVNEFDDGDYYWCVQTGPHVEVNNLNHHGPCRLGGVVHEIYIKVNRNYDVFIRETEKGCNIEARASKPGTYDMRLLRNGANTTLLKTSVRGETWHEFEVPDGWVVDGAENFSVRAFRHPTPTSPGETVTSLVERVGPCKPPPVLEPDLECAGIEVSISRPEPDQRFDMTLRFRNKGSAKAPFNGDQDIRITNDDGLDIPTPHTRDFRPNRIDPGETGEVTFANITAPDPGEYRIRYELTGNASFNHVQNCPADVTVADKPYVRVFGGDVMAGFGFESGGGSCARDLGAQLRAYNKEGTPNWGGSGNQLAAYALSTLEGFVTSQTRGSPGAPKGLSFANSGSSSGGDSTYGGAWNRNYMSCIPNYWTNSSSLPDGSTINARVLPEDRVQTVYVNGDAFVTGDINYQYDEITRIPSFTLVARGNIYIEDNVSLLSGTYVAQNGFIYTCSTNRGNGLPNEQQVATGLCRDNKLVVFGSLIARAIKFQRSNGSTQDSNPSHNWTDQHAAEVIQYSPELWLKALGHTEEVKYDSIISLPPTL